MLKEKILPISILCLAISMIISSIIIAKGFESNGNYISTGMYNGSNQIAHSINDGINVINDNRKDNMDLYTAASYLNVSPNDLMKVILTDEVEFPYVKVGTSYIINKKALDKWIETARFEIE